MHSFASLCVASFVPTRVGGGRRAARDGVWSPVSGLTQLSALGLAPPRVDRTVVSRSYPTARS